MLEREAASRSLGHLSLLRTYFATATRCSPHSQLDHRSPEHYVAPFARFLAPVRLWPPFAGYRQIITHAPTFNQLAGIVTQRVALKSKPPLALNIIFVMASKPIPIRISDPLLQKIRRASERMEMSDQDIIRLCTRIGLNILDLSEFNTVTPLVEKALKTSNLSPNKLIRDAEKDHIDHDC